MFLLYTNENSKQRAESKQGSKGTERRVRFGAPIGVRDHEAQVKRLYTKAKEFK